MMLQLTSRPSLGGFGAISTQQAVSVGTQAGGAVAEATLAPTVAATLGITATAAIPIIGAAVAAIGFGIEAILNSGCGQSCVITSDWANQAEAQLKQNYAAYFAIPTPRPQSVQQAAVANFDTVWNYLVSQCRQVAGAAGTNCIADRQAGACKWKNADGSCFNWFQAYRDPIANDPNVVPDAQLIAANSSSNSTGSSVGSSSTTGSSGTSSLPSWIPLAAAAGLLLIAFMGDS
jgi:hypothetical protein